MNNPNKAEKNQTIFEPTFLFKHKTWEEKKSHQNIFCEVGFLHSILAVSSEASQDCAFSRTLIFNSKAKPLILK